MSNITLSVFPFPELWYTQPEAIQTRRPGPEPSPRQLYRFFAGHQYTGCVQKKLTCLTEIEFTLVKHPLCAYIPYSVKKRTQEVFWQ